MSDRDLVEGCRTRSFFSDKGTNAVVTTRLLSLYRLSTGIVAVKTGMTILYRFSTILPVVKTCSGNIYRDSTGQNSLSEHLHVFTIVKLVCPTSTGFQHASWQSKLPCKTSLVLQQDLCESKRLCWTSTALQLVLHLSKCTYSTSTSQEQAVQ